MTDEQQNERVLMMGGIVLDLIAGLPTEEKGAVLTYAAGKLFSSEEFAYLGLQKCLLIHVQGIVDGARLKEQKDGQTNSDN